MRGEIFFAERWLIVEGQADYLLVHAMAHGLDYDLDRHGVSVIDAQNNGNPAAFAALARALDIPWLAVFDGDQAGMDYVKAIRSRGFAEDEVAHRCGTHDAGDLEAQLLADGLGPELRTALGAVGVGNAPGLGDDALLSELRDKKTAFAGELSERFRGDRALAQRGPKAFREAFLRLRRLT